MIIKKVEGTRATKQINWIKRIFNILAYTSLLATILIIAITIFYYHNNPRNTQNMLKKLDHSFRVSNMMQLPKIFKYRIEGMFSTPESININIKHLDLQKIEYMRKNALKGEKSFDYVPAKITYGTENLKAKIRLKGDRIVHFDTLENASFRVKIKGENTLFGMKIFSIQRPRVRNYIEEWVYLKMMQDEGLIAPRYKFINVSVNGKNNGIFVAEEHYSKYLIENSKHKDGPIIRFNENTSHNFRIATIEPFESKKWKKKENLSLVKKAIYLLDGFRQGDLSIDEVFNIEKLAKFFAISDLNLARHGVVTKSLRFYYNPITSKLEPIPFDGHRGTDRGIQIISAELGITKDKNWTYNEYGNWFRVFFNNKKTYNKQFYSEYIKTLKRISRKNYLDSFFILHKDEIDEILKLIYSDNSLTDNIFGFGPFPYYFNKQSYYATQKSIKNLLQEHKIEAYLAKSDQNSVIVGIKNKNSALPLEIISLAYNKNLINYEYHDNSMIVENFLHLPRPSKQFKFDIPPYMKRNNPTGEETLKIKYKYPGIDEIYSIDVFPWKENNLNHVQNDIIRMKSNVNVFPFIEVNEKDKIISIKEGTYKVLQNMIIPSGYIFEIHSGVTLNLSKNVLILSHSPLKWLGDKKNPIIIDSANKAIKGQGVVVLKAEGVSSLSYVYFKNLAHPNVNDWTLSGSVSFYESDIKANNIHIEDNDAEDGLNIIRSKFHIQKSSFRNTKSDALDIDFGVGNISDSSFIYSGNDAIDISGTDLNLSKIKIIEVGDKAISAGEQSYIRGNNISIDQAEICITSKDNSKVILSNLELHNSKLGFTAFQKKSEYGPGIIEIKDIIYTNLELDYAVEVGSSLDLNGEVIEGNITDVKKLLYGNTYGKKTK